RPFLAFLRWKKFSLLRVRLYPTTQCLNRVDKFIGLLKTAMDRGETEISDFIDVAQLRHHVGSDLRRSDLASTGFDFMNDIVHRLFQKDETDRTFLTGLGQTVNQLAPIKRLMGTIPLDHA